MQMVVDRSPQENGHRSPQENGHRSPQENGHRSPQENGLCQRGSYRYVSCTTEVNEGVTACEYLGKPNCKPDPALRQIGRGEEHRQEGPQPEYMKQIVSVTWRKK